jgi:pimeloyl-ACP methyl ester carboxylesterase
MLLLRLDRGRIAVPTLRLLFLAVALVVRVGPAGGAEEHSFDSNGVAIHYLVEGEGEPVVLIHGFAANARVIWALPGTLGALARDHRVIALDCRGHGKSGKPHDPKKYGNEMIEDVVRLLDHLKIDRAHVVGYSMGSVIALKLATQHPQRVRSLVLAGGGLVWADSENLFTRELPESLENGKGFLPLFRRLVPREKPPTEEQLQLFNQVLLAMNDPKALSAMLRGSRQLVVEDSEAIKRVQAPTLLLVGSIDPILEAIEPLRRLLPNVRYVEIKGADHLATFSRPEFAAHLKDFLSKQRQR